MSRDSQSDSIFTTALHSGHVPPLDGPQPHVPPIAPSVGYTYDSWADTADALADGQNFTYVRLGGPTQAAFEEAVAALEGADAAVCFASGMAALHAAILTVAHTGGHVVAAEALYGTTLGLLRWLDANMDITLHLVDLTDLDATRLLIEKVEPTALVCEVVSNPIARVIDLPAIAMMAHAVGGQVLVDNTFATPYLLRPLELGADLVAHSATKFINGHGDVLGGVLAGPSDLCHVARGHRGLMGAMMSAFDAWLALRGLRTLPVRMRQACENAAQVAAWLKEQPGVGHVSYPGDPDHPDHEIAKRLFREGVFGAMLAFDLARGDIEETIVFLDALRVVQRVASLGDLTTLVSHPATSSHRGLTPEERAVRGISDSTVRLSIGLEDTGDLLADLEQALRAV